MFLDERTDGGGGRCLLLGDAAAVALARSTVQNTLVDALETPPMPMMVSLPPSPGVWGGMDLGGGMMCDPSTPAEWAPQQLAPFPLTDAWSLMPHPHTLVHMTHAVPDSLVGLLIGVRGASIHAVEQVRS
jgi:hypothetical protein